jgi:hypothetical protein
VCLQNAIKLLEFTRGLPNGGGLKWWHATPWFHHDKLDPKTRGEVVKIAMEIPDQERLLNSDERGRRDPTDPKPPFILASSSTHPENWERNLKMVKVTANGKTIAESNETIVVENNYYFPPNSVDKSIFADSKTRCDPPLACSGAHLTFSPFGYTAPSVHGKGPPSPIPPSPDKLTATSPSQNRRVL